MKRIQYWLVFLLVLAVLISVAGCTLPGLSFSSRTTTNPPVETTSAGVTSSPVPSTTTTSAAATAPTSTSTAINPDFIIPAATANPISVGLPDLASVIAKVQPSVVAINTKVTSLSFFGGTYTSEGAGSGWIIDSSGIIVTNNHVVEGADDITVTLHDGRNFPVESVKTDSVSDMAILKIKADNLPPALTVGDSSAMRVGDWVIAIGNSLGQGISATKGIVSALGVSVAADTGETLYDLIQTDAAINPGNSGGPLVNLAGQVIGINSIKVSQVGVEGMGYAISTKGATPIIDALVKVGYVSRPYLGVTLYTVDETAISQLRLSVDKGVLLRQVTLGGPAEKAGLERYDVITVFDGKEVATTEELIKEIRAHQVGQSVSVTYWRGSSQNTINVTLEQSPSN